MRFLFGHKKNENKNRGVSIIRGVINNPGHLAQPKLEHELGYQRSFFINGLFGLAQGATLD